MTIKISKKDEKTWIVPVFEKDETIKFFNKEISPEDKKEILNLAKEFNFEGKENTTIFIKAETRKILLIGIKKDYNLEDIRIAYSKAFKSLNKRKEKIVLVKVPVEKDTVIKSIVEGLDLTNYKFDKYLSKKDKSNLEFNLDIGREFSVLVKETLIVNNCTKFVRDLVNENSNIIVPKKFESLSKTFAKKHNLKIKVLDEKKIKSEGLNLLDAVGRASEHPARLIMIEYNGNKSSKEKTALVGKGITFDTGGVNLKPSGFVEDMKCDMGGAATVLGIFRAAIELKLKKNLILVLSCAENAIGGTAFKPGDIIKSYSSKTIEIKNTDAEGRLVLADALSYVQKHFKPTQIIDMATLTGACLVALGPSLIASLGNNDEMIKNIFKSGETTGERNWNLPIYDEHRDTLKSKVADISNHGGRAGGTIAAAAFLEKFINDGVKWVHLDIAGAAYFKKPKNYVPEHGTGIGVRLIIEYLKNN